MLQQRVTRGILHLYRSSFIRLQNALWYFNELDTDEHNNKEKCYNILIFKNSSVKYASLLTSISKNIFQLSAPYAHLNYHHRSSSRTFSRVLRIFSRLYSFIGFRGNRRVNRKPPFQSA